MGTCPARFVEELHGEKAVDVPEQGQELVQEQVTAGSHVGIGKEAVVGDEIPGIFQKAPLGRRGGGDLLRSPQPFSPIGPRVFLAVKAAFRLGEKAELQADAVQLRLTEKGLDLFEKSEIHPSADIQSLPGGAAAVAPGEKADRVDPVLFGKETEELSPDADGRVLKLHQIAAVLRVGGQLFAHVTQGEVTGKKPQRVISPAVLPAEAAAIPSHGRSLLYFQDGPAKGYFAGPSITLFVYPAYMMPSKSSSAGTPSILGG